MNKNVVVYCSNYVVTIATGNTDTQQIVINEVGRWFNLKKITYTIAIQELTGMRPVSLAQNNMVLFNFSVVALPDMNKNLCRQPQNVAGAGTNNFMLHFRQPGVYTFENLPIYETFGMINAFQNEDAASTNINATTLFELEFFDPNE